MTENAFHPNFCIDCHRGTALCFLQPFKSNISLFCFWTVVYILVIVPQQLLFRDSLISITEYWLGGIATCTVMNKEQKSWSLLSQPQYLHLLRILYKKYHYSSILLKLDEFLFVHWVAQRKIFFTIRNGIQSDWDFKWSWSSKILRLVSTIFYRSV